MKGTLGILNVGAGDTKLSFDKSNPAERVRAAKIVEDMLKRGYAILIQVGEQKGEPVYQRAHGFDPETCEYIIAGGPDEEIAVADLLKPDQAEAKRKPGRPPMKRVEASGTNAVGVARTSGG